MSNSAQKAQLCKRSGNRQCRNGHNRDDLAGFGPITKNKYWFIIATSRYNCSSVNKNFWHRAKFGNIGPMMPNCVMEGLQSACQSEYWDRIRDSKFKTLPSVYHQCAVTIARTRGIFHIPTDKYIGRYIHRLKKNVCILHTLSTLDLSRHRKFERLIIVFGYWPWPLD